jgi:hypothetical protein
MKILLTGKQELRMFKHLHFVAGNPWPSVKSVAKTFAVVRCERPS